MLLWASKFTTAKIECSFEMSKQTPLGVTFILLAMLHQSVNLSIVPLSCTQEWDLIKAWDSYLQFHSPMAYLIYFNLFVPSVLAHYSTFDQNLDYNLRRDPQKNFLWASRLWDGRRKEPILSYVTKNEKENSGTNGLMHRIDSQCLFLRCDGRKIANAEALNLFLGCHLAIKMKKFGIIPSPIIPDEIRSWNWLFGHNLERWIVMPRWR